MKSIQTKFIMLTLGCLFLSSGFIGGAGIMHAKRAADEESAKTMNLLCAERAQEINALLSRIQQSVRTLAVYATGQLESVDKLRNDPAYLKKYTKFLETVAVNAAMKARGCNDNTAVQAQCEEGNLQTDTTQTDSTQSSGDAL